MAYVDGFLLAVPKANVDAYAEMSRACADVWKDYGAIEYWECVADDVEPGQWTSFPQAVQLKEDETVVFSWIVYPDRATRDACNEKVMNDPRMQTWHGKEPLFDGKRMIFGGFAPVVAIGGSAG
ncbi:MAG: DUF1428 domain-containing protein [Alphaproteobacteria bacterium]|nr:DUF1428 domain-containing protein [Alphaproteobacteria bacterium]